MKEEIHTDLLYTAGRKYFFEVYVTELYKVSCPNSLFSAMVVHLPSNRFAEFSKDGMKPLSALLSRRASSCMRM